MSEIGCRRWRSTTVMLAALAMMALGAGCGSGGRTTSATHEMAAMPPPSIEKTSAAFARLDPTAFAERMKDNGAVLINVHVPYEGELEDTGVFIPYDHIVGDKNLPKDKSTELLLYCRTGRMSEMAVNALHGAGYTHLSHLEGGMHAWEASGRPLIHNPVHGADATATH